MSGKRFDKAPDEVQRCVDSVLGRHHARLLEPTVGVSVSVETFLVYGPRNKDGDQTGPAIQVHGVDAFACIRITKLEERVAGRRDAVMWIDGDDYKKWPPETLEAIIDHELTHLAPVFHPQTGASELDDCGRARLKIRPHDFQVGWFDEVAERHDIASIEVRQASMLMARQMYFPEWEIMLRNKKKRA